MKSRITRRNFLNILTAGISSVLVFCQKKAAADMKLRPHHLLDIITEYGAGGQFEPHPYPGSAS